MRKVMRMYQDRGLAVREIARLANVARSTFLSLAASPLGRLSELFDDPR